MVRGTLCTLFKFPPNAIEALLLDRILGGGKFKKCTQCILCVCVGPVKKSRARVIIILIKTFNSTFKQHTLRA